MCAAAAALSPMLQNTEADADGYGGEVQYYFLSSFYFFVVLLLLVLVALCIDSPKIELADLIMRCRVRVTLERGMVVESRVENLCLVNLPLPLVILFVHTNGTAWYLFNVVQFLCGLL